MEQALRDKERKAEQKANNIIVTDLQEMKDKNKLVLENLLNENNAKERDLEILRKRVMMETNELNGLNGKIMRLTR